jgi:hypothetical protein
LAEVLGLKGSIDIKSHHIIDLERDLAAATNQISSYHTTISSLQLSLRDKQSSLTAARNRCYAIQKQAQRAKRTLKETTTAFKTLQTWQPTKNGQYTAVARALARDLTQAGCSSGKIAFAVESCARAFGIEISRAFMSSRTVGRVIDEGGKYGEIQLGSEILNAPGKIV